MLKQSPLGLPQSWFSSPPNTGELSCMQIHFQSKTDYERVNLTSGNTSVKVREVELKSQVLIKHRCFIVRLKTPRLRLQQAFKNKEKNVLLNKKVGKATTGHARHLWRVQHSLAQAYHKVHGGKTKHILHEGHLLQNASGLRRVTPGINFWYSPFHHPGFALTTPCRVFMLSPSSSSCFLVCLWNLWGDRQHEHHIQRTDSSALATAFLSGMGPFPLKERMVASVELANQKK